MDFKAGVTKLNTAYTKAVFTASYNYLLGLMELDSGIRRVHVLCAKEVDGEEKQITYSIGPEACVNLTIADECLSFSARFNGVSQDIIVPWHRVYMIFSPEFQSFFVPNLHDPYALMARLQGDETEPNKLPESTTKKPSLRVLE